MNPIMVSKILVGMSANNIHLVQFKIQGPLQKRGVFVLFQSPFRVFAYQNT